MTSNVRCFALACLLAMATGCGPAMSDVSGTVTAGDRPIVAGVIAFSSADGQGESTSVEIKDGKYALRTTSGNKVVQVSAPVVVGKHPEYNGPGAPLVEITEESVPARFNTASELRCELKPGPNVVDFAVETRRVTRQGAAEK